MGDPVALRIPQMSELSPVRTCYFVALPAIIAAGGHFGLSALLAGMEASRHGPRHRLTGPKYAYFDELAPYLDRGQSLVVYHHLHRSVAHESQVRDRLSQVEERLGLASSSFWPVHRLPSGRR